MTDKRKDILDRIYSMANQVGDLQAHLELFKTACEQLKREKSEAILRAEKAEAELVEAQQAAEFWFEQAKIAGDQQQQTERKPHQCNTTERTPQRKF